MMFTGFSCKKESAEPQSAKLIDSVSFIANAQLYTWNGAYPANPSDIEVPSTGLSLLRLTDPHLSDNRLVIAMKFSTMALGTYKLTIDTTTSVLNVPDSCELYYVETTGAAIAASTDMGDFGTVTITRIHDGYYADGTFSAQMTEYSRYGPSSVKLNITNGTFQNLPSH